MPLSCLFHNAAALIRRGPVYLSAFRSCDHIYSAHEPLCSPVSQQQLQLSPVVCKIIWQSDQRLQGQLQVWHWSYVHVRLLAVNVWTQVCLLPSCMYVRVTGPSCNSISKQSTGEWWEMRLSGWILLPWWGRWWWGRCSHGIALRTWPSSPSCRRAVHLFHNTSVTARRCTHNTW